MFVKDMNANVSFNCGLQTVLTFLIVVKYLYIVMTFFLLCRDKP